MAQRRRDNKGRILKEGESQRKDGSYDYRWRDKKGKRHAIYGRTLEELREKEDDILQDQRDGIRSESRQVTVNEMFDVWLKLKRGLKDNTLQNYIYMYNMFVRDDIGTMRLCLLRHSDIRRFYNTLYEVRGVKISTVDVIHNVLHQVLELAVQDNYLRNNISDNALKELKLMHNQDNGKKKALTKPEQYLFLNYLKRSKHYEHWYPIFAIMVHTGMRVSEITGLRWCDVDLKKGVIDVNHTLIYYKHRQNGCYYNIHTPKTQAGTRTIPMLSVVKEAFAKEREYQESAEISCNVTIDGYTDFVFINRFGNVHNQGTLNRAIKRIIRDCNQDILENSCGNKNVLLLPNFSCHSLRHTFATRMCEAGMNLKAMQDILGHADYTTTMNIYTDATEELKESEISELDEFLKKDEQEDTEDEE